MGEVSRGGVSPRLNREGVRRWVLLSKMTFQEVLLIRICTVNVQDEGRVEKYIRKSCCHHIEYSAANSLAAFMWRRLLNNTALVTLTHKEPIRVSDRTSTQMVTWTIDKWRAKIIQREIYNIRDPWGKEGSRNQEKNTVAIKNQSCNQTCEKYMRTNLLGLYQWRFSLV